MNFYKKLSAIVGATLLFCFVVHAQVGGGILTTNFAVAQTNQFALSSATVPMEVYQVQLSSTATIPNTVYLWDGAGATNTLQIPAYVYRASYTTNMGQIGYDAINQGTVFGYNVTTTGITNYLTNSVLWTYMVTNAAANTPLPINATFVVPANSTITYNVQGCYFEKGVVTGSTTTNLTISLFWRKLR